MVSLRSLGLYRSMGGINLHQVTVHCCNAVSGGTDDEGFGAGNLLGGVSLPEGAAGDFGELNVVAHQIGVLLMQELYFIRIQFNKFCRSVSPFVFAPGQKILPDVKSFLLYSQSLYQCNSH